MVDGSSAEMHKQQKLGPRQMHNGIEWKLNPWFLFQVMIFVDQPSGQSAFHSFQAAKPNDCHEAYTMPLFGPYLTTSSPSSKVMLSVFCFTSQELSGYSAQVYSHSHVIEKSTFWGVFVTPSFWRTI
jgi:hypothetical protein